MLFGALGVWLAGLLALPVDAIAVATGAASWWHGVAVGGLVGLLAGALVGLLVDTSLVEWAALDSFAVTDDPLVVVHDAWFGERTFRFDRDDHADEDAVVAALERFGVERVESAE